MENYSAISRWIRIGTPNRRDRQRGYDAPTHPATMLRHISGGVFSEFPYLRRWACHLGVRTG